MSLGAQSRECVIFANIGAHASVSVPLSYELYLDKVCSLRPRPAQEINQRIRLLDNDIRVMKSASVSEEVKDWGGLKGNPIPLQLQGPSWNCGSWRVCAECA